MQFFSFDKYATKREIDILSKTITSELDDLKDDVDSLKINQSGLMGGITTIKWLMTALLIPIGIMLMRDLFVDRNVEVKQSDEETRMELRILQEQLKMQQQFYGIPQNPQ